MGQSGQDRIDPTEVQQLSSRGMRDDPSYGDRERGAEGEVR